MSSITVYSQVFCSVAPNDFSDILMFGCKKWPNSTDFFPSKFEHVARVVYPATSTFPILLLTC